MRQTAVDMEQNKELLETTSIQYNIRQKYMCYVCVPALFSGVFLFLGFYLGYTFNDCEGSSLF